MESLQLPQHVNDVVQKISKWKSILTFRSRKKKWYCWTVHCLKLISGMDLPFCFSIDKLCFAASGHITLHRYQTQSCMVVVLCCKHQEQICIYLVMSLFCNHMWWVMTFLFTIANLVKMNLQIFKLHVCTTLTNFSTIQFGFQESCYMLVTSWNGLSTHGDFRREIPQNLVTLVHSFPQKSFAWIALDFYFFGCQVGKICPSVSMVVTCSLVTMLTSFCFGVKCFWKGLVLQTSILLHPHPL